MNKHPSLNTEYEDIPSLEPQQVMGRNKSCWCGSGIKWKKCHKDRHIQKGIPIGKLTKEMLLNQKHGICLHPEASTTTCSNRIIKAHTVQRAGALSKIAEEGHVISEKKGFENIFKNEGEIAPRLVGISDASTFMGFCSTHDNSLFEPIENNNFSLNQAAFLLAFRALAYEYLAKKNSLNAIKIQREIDKGKNFEKQIAIQIFLHAYQVGL
ncbi:MAG: SEC-C domain-containing protein [Gammaproteobacteria bacterium]|nr:SEC-C domain-containing protein [Gammaproteobacteria bacterium]